MISSLLLDMNLNGPKQTNKQKSLKNSVLWLWMMSRSQRRLHLSSEFSAAGCCLLFEQAGGLLLSFSFSGSLEGKLSTYSNSARLEGGASKTLWGEKINVDKGGRKQLAASHLEASVKRESLKVPQYDKEFV